MNPQAGARSGADLVDRLRNLLEARGYSVLVLTDPERMADEAARCQDDGTLRTVVAARARLRPLPPGLVLK